MRASAERIAADIEAIAAYSSEGPGVTRLSFTPEYWAAVDYVTDVLAALGYERRITSHGNSRFRLRGGGWDRPAIVVGSHLDTVPHGGRFDGVAGVVAAVEIARLLAEDEIDLNALYEVVIFAEEEGTRFGSVLLGSRAMTGQLTDADLLSLEDEHGLSYSEAVRQSCGPAVEPGGALGIGDMTAYFELHIEQSLVLHDERIPVGVVNSIAGIRQYMLEFSGRADHAGATPMPLRLDTLVAAAEAIRLVETQTSASEPGAVGTVGMLVNEPNASNVVPGRTLFSVDIRHSDAHALDEVSGQVLDGVKEIVRRRGIRASIQSVTASEPTALSQNLRENLVSSAKRQGISFLEMPSGAVHDAQAVASIADAAMIFVPSIGGRSHCPEEDTPYESIAIGTDVIMGALRAVPGGPGA